MSGSPTKIESDITVYGATSFTAKHVLRYLYQFALLKQKKEGGDAKDGVLRVTLAGRNMAKLVALKNLPEFQLPASGTTTTTTRPYFEDVFVASSLHRDSLRQMVQRTRVVLNCAGPFALYSSPVVAACAEHGTDYVDITGEGPWNAEMRLKYNKLSTKSGAKIISFCGYDSIPSDIALYAAVTALRERKKGSGTDDGGGGGQVPIESATLWHTMAGIPSGGTLRTMATYPVDLVRDFFDKTRNYSLRPTPYFLDDPLQLSNPEAIKYNPDYAKMKSEFAWSEWMNQLVHVDIPFGLGVSFPMPMSPINMYVYIASSC